MNRQPMEEQMLRGLCDEMRCGDVKATPSQKELGENQSPFHLSRERQVTSGSTTSSTSVTSMSSNNTAGDIFVSVQTLAEHDHQEPKPQPVPTRVAFRESLRDALEQRHLSVQKQVEQELQGILQGALEISVHQCSAGEDCRCCVSEATTNSVGSPPLVLLSGASGCGKTRLAYALRDAVENKLGGYFVTGRFGEKQDPTPYPAFVAALEEFTKLVVQRGPDEVARVRGAIQDAVGAEAFVLSRFVPCLDALLDRSSLYCGEPKVTTTPPQSSDAILRFIYVFGSFFRAVSSPQCPLVLFMDDLHYGDPCSINILSTCLMSTTTSGFAAIATLEADKVQRDSLLSLKLREIEDFHKTKLLHFALAPFDEAILCEVLSEFFASRRHECLGLSAIVHRQTGGRLLYILELLSWLYESESLSFDPDAGLWMWETQEIEVSMGTLLSLTDLITRRLMTLSAECLNLLKVASCLGYELNETLIAHALGQPIESALSEAIARGGLIVHDISKRLGGSRRLRFESARVQSAAHSLISKEHASLFHLEIGRRIWRKLDGASTETHLFALLSQLRLGQDLIQRAKERNGVATLCLHAGIKAARSSSFRVAAVYLDLGINMLGEKRWRENYEMSLALHNAAAEMAMCTGNCEAMNTHLNEIFTHARLFKDTIQAHATRIYSHGMSEQQPKAVEEGIVTLRNLGLRFPSNVNKVHMMVEMVAVRRLLRKKSNCLLLRMPTMTDESKRFCMQILSLVYQNAMLARPEVLPLVILHMMKITLVHGMSEYASMAFANYAVFCIKAYGNVEMAYRYGSLGLALLERFQADEFLPRVYASYYGNVYVHRRPIKDSLPPLAKAYRIGLHTGDLEAAFLCASNFCMNAIEAGVPLPEVEHEYREIHRRMEASNQHSMATSALIKMQVLHDLMGLSKDPLSPEGGIINYEEVYEHAQQSGRKLLAMVVLARRMTVAYILNEYEQAAKMMGFLRRFEVIPPGAPKNGLMMTAGLCCIELARLGKNKRRNLRQAKKMIRQLRVYASQQPVNTLDKLYLVQAELASLRNQRSRAEQKYTAAIALADISNFRYVRAKARECLARHLFRLGDDDAVHCREDARLHFDEACRIYQEWGAVPKYSRLSQEVAAMYAANDSLNALPQRCKAVNCNISSP